MASLQGVHDMKNLKGDLSLKYCERHFKTGSRVICDPPPTDTDADYVVLTLSLSAFDAWATSTGFHRTTPEQHAEYDGQENPIEFQTYRMGELNLIVTQDAQFYDDWLLATRVAQLLNVMDKGKRIALFQGILYGEWNAA